MQAQHKLQQHQNLSSLDGACRSRPTRAMLPASLLDRDQNCLLHLEVHDGQSLALYWMRISSMSKRRVLSIMPLLDRTKSNARSPANVDGLGPTFLKLPSG